MGRAQNEMIEKVQVEVRLLRARKQAQGFRGDIWTTRKAHLSWICEREDTRAWVRFRIASFGTNVTSNRAIQHRCYVVRSKHSTVSV